MFAFVPDPIGLGVAESLAHPGGNFTGVTYSEAVLGGKRLEVLIDALPATRRIAVLWSRAHPENIPLFESIQSAAAARGVDVVSRELQGVEDLAPAFGDAARAGAQAVLFIPENRLFGRRKHVCRTRARPPASVHPFLRRGGAGRRPPILRAEHGRKLPARRRPGRPGPQGRAPRANSPVEQPTAFELVVNLKTAAALGLTIPETFLIRADEVIE